MSAAPNEALPDIREAERYLGYGKNQPGDDERRMISECFSAVSAAVSYRCVYTMTDVSRPRDGVLDLGFGNIESASLYRHMSGCGRALLFAATAGRGLDMLITSLSSASPAKGVIADALGSSAVEKWCDLIEKRLLDGVPHVFRFSAGYGDFDISWQKNILEYLSANIKAGIYTTDALMMLPTKSVTAIVGIKTE